MRKRFGVFVILAVVAAAIVGAAYFVRSRPLALKVAQVEESVPISVFGLGTVEARVISKASFDVGAMIVELAADHGDCVKKGDVLARIDPVVYKAQYDQAVAKKAQDEATLANARIDLQRYQRLAQTNAGSQQQADQQAALVAQLQAQVKADQAAIDNAKAFLDYTTILAPIDGRVGLRQVDPGNIIHTGDSNGLVSITQIDPIAVVFTLPQRDLPAVTSALAWLGKPCLISSSTPTAEQICPGVQYPHW